MRRFWTILLSSILLLFGGVTYAEVVNLPAEEAYDKALDYVLEIGAMPNTTNEKLRIFKTDLLSVKLTHEECDCGKMFGIPYMKDKRMRTAVSYQVRVKKVDDNSSDVKVKVTVEGYMAVNDHKLGFFADKSRDKGKVLDCKSTGVLEKRFIEAISH